MELGHYSCATFSTNFVLLQLIFAAGAVKRSLEGQRRNTDKELTGFQLFKLLVNDMFVFLFIEQQISKCDNFEIKNS